MRLQKCRPKAMKDLVVDDKEAIRQYAEKFGECRDGTDAGPNSASLGVTGPGYNRTAFPWFKGPAPKKPDAVPAEASLSKRHYVTTCVFRRFFMPPWRSPRPRRSPSKTSGRWILRLAKGSLA